MAHQRCNWQHWLTGATLAVTMGAGHMATAQSDTRTRSSNQQQSQSRSMSGGNYEYETYNEESWWDSGNGQSSSLMQGQTTIEGRITEVGQVRLANADRQHMVLKVRSDQGREMIVDLGPAQEVQRYNLQRGDRITAEGRMTRKSNKQILSAQQIEYDGNRINIQRMQASSARQQRWQDQQTLGDQFQSSDDAMRRSRRMGRDMSDMRSMDDMRMDARSSMEDGTSRRTISGRVMRTGTARLPDQQGIRNVAEVRVEGGRDILVDLGSGQQADVERGDRVELRGTFDTETHGRQVFIASTARINGQSQRITRTDDNRVRWNAQASDDPASEQASDDRDYGTYGYTSDQDQTQSSQGDQRIEGRVLSIRQATGPRGRVTVLTVQTEDGRRHIVDVDPAVLRVTQVDLGDSVMVLGTYGYRDESRVLEANSVRSTASFDSGETSRDARSGSSRTGNYDPDATSSDGRSSRTGSYDADETSTDAQRRSSRTGTSSSSGSSPTTTRGTGTSE